MEDGESILTEKHAIPLLLFVLNNEGCLMSDLQYSVTKNFDTVRRLCVKMSDAGLMEDRNVRERKLITRYYLTKKGVTVAMMLKCAIDAWISGGSWRSTTGPSTRRRWTSPPI